MQINQQGCSRLVILTKRYAFKLPALINSANRLSWKSFLHGLLANMQEAQFGRSCCEGLCPVRFFIPGGFLVVMPRAVEITDEEFLAMDIEGFIDRGDYCLPVEKKANSFGWLDGEIVAIDSTLR